MSISIKEKNFKDLDRVELCPVELDLVYQVLDPSEEHLVKAAAECLADTFTGIEIAGKKIYEPIVVACKLTKDDMQEFIMGYLKNIVNQGLCLIARQKDIGNVIAVLACEDFNPYEKTPFLEGNLAPINEIIKLVEGMNEKFVDTVRDKTGRKVKQNEYIQVFMAGAKLETLKRFAIMRLFEMVIDIGIEQGYKGIIALATNKRSEKLSLEYCGFHLVKDTFDNPIQANYCDYQLFKSIPPDEAEACKVVFRALHPQYDI